jgi:lysozyme
MMLGLTGRRLIQRFERCCLEAYPDDRGIETIGFGHTGKDVYPGLTWSQAQADSHFLIDTSTAQYIVNKTIKVPVNQNQFDAMCSLAFNIGETAFGCSTLGRMVNSGDLVGAAAQFPLWDHEKINGAERVDPGLETRREAEEALFKTPV